MKMLPVTAFFLVCLLTASAQVLPNIPNCNVPLELLEECGLEFATALTGDAGSFCSGNCAERLANTYASCGAAGTPTAQLIQQGCGRNSGNNYCFSFVTRTPLTTPCSELGCCARANLAAPAFANQCNTTEPACATTFSLNGGGSSMNGGSNMNGSSNTTMSTGGSPGSNMNGSSNTTMSTGGSPDSNMNGSSNTTMSTGGSPDSNMNGSSNTTMSTGGSPDSNMNGSSNTTMSTGGSPDSNMNGSSITTMSTGGSPSINSMAMMFTSFLLAAVALLFHP